MSSVKYMLGLVIVATLACTAFAIRCYQCDSVRNPKCGEHFEAEDSMKFDCNRMVPDALHRFIPGSNATGCMKQLMAANGVGAPYIARTCYFGDIVHKIGCNTDNNQFVKQLSCDVCKDDLCNGSSSMTPVAFAIVAFFGLARLFS